MIMAHANHWDFPYSLVGYFCSPLFLPDVYRMWDVGRVFLSDLAKKINLKCVYVKQLECIFFEFLLVLFEGNERCFGRLVI